MKIAERYASAIRSSNLKVDMHTADGADPLVLGAMGIADRELTEGKTSQGDPVKPSPLAVPLERLFLGDNAAAAAVVEILGRMAWERAKAQRIRLKRVEASDMARACLAWHRDGKCKACGGHGFLLIKGTPTIGNKQCKVCKGKGSIPFEKHFPDERLLVARWLVDEMQRAQGRAGPRAMAKLADALTL